MNESYKRHKHVYYSDYQAGVISVSIDILFSFDIDAEFFALALWKAIKYCNYELFSPDSE